nr:hypothetical protein JG1_0190 [uncultured bacterium]
MILVALLVILVSALGLIGWLFYSFRKETPVEEVHEAVPITDINEIKKPQQKPIAFLGEKNAPQSVIENVEPAKNAVSFEPTIEAVAEKTSLVTEKDQSKAADQDEKKASDDEIRQLKEEVKLIREKAVIQARNALEVINKLRDEAEKLRSENIALNEGKNASIGHEDMIVHLKAENAGLKERADQVEEKMRNFESAITRDRESAERQIVCANATIEQLRSENATLTQAAQNVGVEIEKVREQYQSQLDSFYNEIEKLKRINNDLQKQTSDSVDHDAVDQSLLHGRINALIAENTDLKASAKAYELELALARERGSQLQFELTKAHAQAVGFERIYENSRKQLESMSNEINESRIEQKDVSKKANMFEQNLVEFRRLNSELLKREKLTQFELEKNREQLEELEKIYSGFRTRLERIGEPGLEVRNY